MATTINLTNCSSSSSKITGASIGNGKCYSESNGTYTFSSCYDVAACAGNSGVTSISVSPSSMSSGGSSATFTIYCYGTSSVSYTKSGEWSGTSSATPGSSCYSTATVTLSNPGANTGISYKTWTITSGGKSATVTQSPKKTNISIIYNFGNNNSNVQTFTVTVTPSGGTTITENFPVTSRGTSKGTKEIDIYGSPSQVTITLSCSRYPTTLMIDGMGTQCRSSSYTRTRTSSYVFDDIELSGEVCN